MKIGDEVYIHGYIDEIRKDTIIIYNDGGYFGTVADEIVSGELRTKQDIDSVIDDIKAEIEQILDVDWSDGLYQALRIIDKHISGKEIRMTKEQKDKILIALTAERNAFATDCNRRIAKENGKIEGADYMLQRFLDILNTEVEPQERIK